MKTYLNILYNKSLYLALQASNETPHSFHDSAHTALYIRTSITGFPVLTH